ncbi:MAG: SPOR domain-containing protein [Alsobacter sp.]
MTDQNRSRPVIDLDELERQLREAAAPRQPEPQAPGRDDPLAELARIVGQDDPSRGSWRSPRAAPVAAAPPPAAPASSRYPADDFEAELAALTRGEPFQQPDQPMAPPPRPGEPARVAPEHDLSGWDLRTAPEPDHDDRVVAFDGHGRSHGYAPSREDEPVYEAQGQLPPHEEVYEEIAPKPRRKGLYAVGTVMGVAVVGIAAALAMRGTGAGLQTASAPPVIKAESGPMKVQPANPGGVVVPNQDNVIFTRKAEDMKGAKMVGGEEQPVDVAAKVQQAKAAGTAPATGGSSSTSAAIAGAPATSVELPKPPQPTAVVQGLGEPRKVRTVSVRPDGTIIDGESTPMARTAALAPGTLPAIPVPVSPPAVTGATPAPKKPETTAAVAIPPVPTPSVTTPVAPRPVAAPVEGAATPARAVPAPAAPKPAQVAAVAPSAIPSGAAAPATDAGGGGFTVQLAAPGSEQEARDTATRLERRFSGELGGMKPFVRRAEVNGKTIYRVRVGNLPRDEATSLCVRVQSAGGQCFVARN